MPEELPIPPTRDAARDSVMGMRQELRTDLENLKRTLHAPVNKTSDPTIYDALPSHWENASGQIFDPRKPALLSLNPTGDSLSSATPYILEQENASFPVRQNNNPTLHKACGERLQDKALDGLPHLRLEDRTKKLDEFQNQWSQRMSDGLDVSTPAHAMEHSANTARHLGWTVEGLVTTMLSEPQNQTDFSNIVMAYKKLSALASANISADHLRTLHDNNMVNAKLYEATVKSINTTRKAVSGALQLSSILYPRSTQESPSGRAAGNENTR